MGSITELPPAPSRAAPVTFSDLADAFIAAMPTMVQQINAVEDEFEAAVAAPAWSGTSTTSLSIGTGSKTLTIQAGKSINIGMSVKIANSNDGTQWMFGDVTAYNSGTGSLTVNVTHTNGSGTIATWTVTMSGPEGPMHVWFGPEPASPVAYDLWIDASGNITQRNSTNTAWGTSLTGLGVTPAAQSILDDTTIAAICATLQSTYPGEIKMYGGASAPDGWLLCDGSAISRTTYAGLFAVIGTSFGIGNGSTTFNVPDLRGRVPCGVGTGIGGGASDTDGGSVPAGGSALTARSLGEWVGAETHTLAETEIPAHTHGEAGAHHHHYDRWTDGGLSFNGGDISAMQNVSTDTDTQGAHTHTSVGGGQAHNNLQPIMCVNFIIKT